MIIPLFCQAVKPQPLYAQKNQVQEEYVNTDLCLDVAFAPAFSGSEMSTQGWIQWPIQNRQCTNLGVWAFYHKYQSLHDFYSWPYKVDHICLVCCEEISCFPFYPAATPAHRSGKRVITGAAVTVPPRTGVYCTRRKKAVSATVRYFQRLVEWEGQILAGYACGSIQVVQRRWHDSGILSLLHPTKGHKNILAFSLAVAPGPQSHC